MNTALRVKSWEKIKEGYLIHTNGPSLKLIFLTDDVFRVRTNFNNDWSEASYILTQTAWDDHCDEYIGAERKKNAPLFPSHEESDSNLIFQTSSLKVVLAKDPLAFEVYDTKGNLLHADIPSRAFVQDYIGRVYHYSSFTEEKHIYYGFGEHNGSLEKNYQRLRLSPKDAIGHNPNTGGPMYKHIPMYIKHNSENGISVGMFYHNTYDCEFDVGAEVSGYWPRYTYFTAESGEIDWFFINGPTMDAVVQRYTDLTGKTTMPPKYSLGYLGSTMYYVELPRRCDTEIVDFIDKNFSENIPIDGFQLSSGYTVGSDGKRYFFTWNNMRFPNPKKFFSEMNKRGVMCSPNIKPGILLTHPNYKDWDKVKGFILNPEKSAPYVDKWWGGDGSFVDFTSPEGREVWKNLMTDSLIKNGVSSIWNDNCEFEINDKLAWCNVDGKGGIAAQWKNVQVLLMNKVSHEALEKECPNDRPFVVCRSGSAGIQRYASTWAGDNPTRWDTLQNNIATVLNMGLSGVAHSGCDIGGFQGPHPEEELLVRWVQTGIFFPRFSIHSCNNDNTVTEPWMYKKSTPLIREAIRLRYSLLPYFYSLMREAHDLGTPIIRPLCYEFPNDEKALRQRYQFMLGTSLLVAPVVHSGVKEISIYLPSGSYWYDYYTRQRYEGGQTIIQSVDMASIPVFIRENAFVARNSEVFSIRNDKETYWDIVVAASKSASYTLYEDDGISNDYLKGKFLKTHVNVTAGTRITLDINYEGSYKSSVKTIYLDVINVDKGPFKVFLDENELPQILDEVLWEKSEMGWRYDADLKSARVKYPKPTNDYKVVVSFEPFDLIGMAITENQL
ncbi:MAG: TIM-barrel domain-containing protein [Brevinema sp.]